MYNTEFNLPDNIIPGNPDEFTRYFTMDISVLDKLTAQNCANISYRLSQYALFIQRCVNHHSARAKELLREINHIIAPTLNQYRGNWEMQRVSAILDNDVAKQYDDELIAIQKKIEGFQSMANFIDKLSSSMKNIQFSKKE